MPINWELLVGLLGIAVAIFVSLAIFKSGITNKLERIDTKINSISQTAEKVWDLVNRKWGGQIGTITRELPNLGKIKITAEPGLEKTIYTIDIEKPILHFEYLAKVEKETKFDEYELRLFKKKATGIVLSPQRTKITVPCVEPKTCTEYITNLLQWLNDKYAPSIRNLKDYEEGILA